MSEEENRKLRGWKEIAAHLGITTRSAQNWENNRGLPVRRMPGQRGTVYLLLSDLRRWQNEHTPAALAAGKTDRSRIWALLGGAVLLAVLGLALWLLGSALSELLPSDSPQRIVSAPEASKLKRASEDVEQVAASREKEIMTNAEMMSTGIWYQFSNEEGHPGTPHGCQPADPLGMPCAFTPGFSVPAKAPPWNFNVLEIGATLFVTDDQVAGESFEILDYGVSVGFTPDVPMMGTSNQCFTDPGRCFDDPDVSSGTFLLSSGRHSIEILYSPTSSSVSDGSGFLKVEPAATPCVGFDLPIDKHSVTVLQGSEVLTLRAELFDANGVPVTYARLASPPTIRISVHSLDEGQPTVVSADSLRSTAGTKRYQFEFRDDRWEFELRANDFPAAGAYLVRIISGDATEYRIIPACESILSVE